MKLSEMRSSREVLSGQLADPEFAAEWQRTALARAVAIEVIRYRSEHELSQGDLARQLGMRQPQVARIEAGEHAPTIETLLRLAVALDVEIALDIRPAGTAAALLSADAAQAADTVDSGDAALSVVTVALAAEGEKTGAVRRITSNSAPRPRPSSQTEPVVRSGHSAARSTPKGSKRAAVYRAGRSSGKATKSATLERR